MTTYTEPKQAEKTASEMTAEHLEWALQQPAVGTCTFCPEYRVEGTCEEVKAANAEHRETFHPERKRSSRRRRGTTAGILSYAQSLTDEELEVIQAKRNSRLRALGIIPE